VNNRQRAEQSVKIQEDTSTFCSYLMMSRFAGAIRCSVA